MLCDKTCQSSKTFHFLICCCSFIICLSEPSVLFVLRMLPNVAFSVIYIYTFPVLRKFKKNRILNLTGVCLLEVKFSSLIVRTLHQRDVTILLKITLDPSQLLAHVVKSYILAVIF